MALDPALKALLDAMAASGAPGLDSLPPVEARVMFDNMPLPRREIAVASVENRKIPGPAGEIPVRIYRPEGAGVKPVLVYFHGGGWVIGSLDSYDATCRELCVGAGCVVVSIDYRLAPEQRYPAAADDCYAGVRWVAANAASLGVDARRIAVGGDSAGGNLAAVVALMARDKGGPAICFQFLVYPVTDAAFTTASYVENAEGYLLTAKSMKWFWDHYAPSAAQRREAYAKRLQQAGVSTTLTRYDGLIHGFISMGLVAPRAQLAIDEAVAALMKGLAS
jgi:acetyl esterase